MTHVHLIGIGGTGLSAIARVLLESGYTVSGSDRSLSPLAQSLQAAGVRVYLGHQPENISGADLVVRSSAISDDNPEVQAARAAGIPVYKRADFLGRLMQNCTGIAVAGTHGKTTTTAMITWMLVALQQDPSYIVGGVLKNLGANAHAGKGSIFVIEADEYDRMFLGLQPQMIVVTNMEHDHPDCYPTPADYALAFRQFCDRLQPDGTVFTCADDPGAQALYRDIAGTRRAYTYGFAADADYQALNLTLSAQGSAHFDAVHRQSDGSLTKLASVELHVPGEHNVRNALAAMAVAHQLNLSLAQAARALESFSGTGRRFEVRGEEAGVTVIDDYAHHPTEIRATLAAARARYHNRRIWAVWQPHTYSRTQTLLDAFAASFDDADRVIVTDIYAAREPKQAFSGADIVRRMEHPAAQFISTLDAVSSYLIHQLQPGDVLIVLSAGDADQISANVLEALQESEAHHA
jgi:UDP-N-acetylmuramate--alanine ligase